MHILELTKPGSFLIDNNEGWAFQVGGLLSQLESAFLEANVALNLFNESQNLSLEIISYSKEQWELDGERRRELEVILRSEQGLQPFDDYENVSFEVGVRLKRERWEQGEIPMGHSRCLALIYSKSFLYTLDTINQLLRVISENPKVPSKIRDLFDLMNIEIPLLRPVRNSAHHVEDRARSLGAKKRGKYETLELKPIDNGFIKSSGGVLALNNLCGSKFGTVMADGHYGEVDISFETLVLVQNIVQDAFNSFDWTGPKVHLPN